MAVAILSVSCNRHSEPPTEVLLQISESFVPQTLSVDKNDSEMLEKIREWNTQSLVVNSADELPDDPIGFSPAFSKINFKERTLLIAYNIHRWRIDAYTNRWIRNNVESTYDWYIQLGISEFPDEDDVIYFTRFAIEVPKLPADANVRFWYSHSDLGFDWDE